jgi:hypothetical protein
MHHQVHIDEKNPVTRVFKNIGYRMVSAILIIGVFVGSSILIVNTPERPYGQFALYMSSCIIVILLLKALFARKK